MERKKQVLSVGAMAVVLALVLRFFAIAGPDNEALLSLLIYLQTGHLVRYSQSVTPVTTIPSTKPETGLQFTARDSTLVEFYDFTNTAPDIHKLLLSPLSWDLTGKEPTVLILHTHATESYTPSPGEIYEESSDYRTLNPSYNMLSIGEELTRVLENGGITVLHDRTLHDYPSYSGSYDHARKTISAYLQAYPSIRLVIDLHRDALDLGADTQLSTSAMIGTQNAAQLMLVAGSHSKRDENLALNVKLTALLEKMYPGITRPLQLRKQKFNLDMTPGSILVEVGANGDTHPEAILAVRALGAAIIALSKGANL